MLHFFYQGASGSIWKNLEASGSIWKHLAVSGSIWKHLESLVWLFTVAELFSEDFQTIFNFADDDEQIQVVHSAAMGDSQIESSFLGWCSKRQNAVDDIVI